MLPDTALAFLLLEHRWAQPLFDAIAETGGRFISEGFLTAETGLVIGAEVAAMEEAARVIAAAHAAEADATLRAMAAATEAAEAVAASAAIRAAAAAEAIRALITAGLVEEAAAHEAVEALAAAGLIVAEADEAAAEALAADDAAVTEADQAAAEALAEAAATLKASVDHHGRGAGPPLPADTVDVLGHRRQSRDLSIGGEGTSPAGLQEAGGS